MARSRDTRLGHDKKALPAAKNGDDGAILGEIVDTPTFVTPQVVTVLIEGDKEDDLEKLLEAELKYNEKRFAIIRAHKDQDPDAVEHRKTRAFRRHAYMVLLFTAVGILIAMPFVNLVTAGVFGTIGMIIVCGVMLNARDRELDLAGMLKMIQAILRRKK